MSIDAPVLESLNDESGLLPEFKLRLTKQLKNSAKLLSRQEARYLVDQYYAIQKFRIHSANQQRAAQASREPNDVIDLIPDQFGRMEAVIKSALGAFAAEYTVGRWMQSLVGIGPVISAGFLAHLDVRGKKTYGHFWSFAGLDPSKKWDKGQKRPWNAALKTLCWKFGQSVVKTKAHKESYYGPLFDKAREKEIRKNESGANAEAARIKLETVKIGKDTDAYKYYSDGTLPPAHTMARATRFVEKLFLSHLHHVMHCDYYGVAPPNPYPFERMPNEDHRHYIAPPNWPFDDCGKSLRELYGDPASA